METEQNIEFSKDSNPMGSNRRVYILTTAAIYLGNFAQGWAQNSFGPLLFEFAKKYDTDIDAISLVFTIYMISYMVGALFTNILFRYVNRQLCVVVALAGLAVSMYFVPHCPTILSLYILAVFFGLATGVYDTSQVVWIIEMWQAAAGPYIQAQYFFNSGGSLSTGLILSAFLAEVDEATESDTTTVESDGSYIVPWVPFTIVGVLATLASVVQLLLLIFKPYHQPPQENVEKVEEEKSTTSTPKIKLSTIFTTKVKLIALAVIFFTFYLSMETSTSQYISSFGLSVENPLSSSDASLLLSALIGSNAVGRFIGIGLTMKIPQQHILFGNMIIILGASTLLHFSNSNTWIIWVGTCILGLGFSTTTASLCGYVGRHIEFTNIVGSLMLVGGSIGGAVYPQIMASFIEDNVFVLVYVNFVTVGIVSIAFAFILYLTSTGWSFLKCSVDYKK